MRWTIALAVLLVVATTAAAQESESEEDEGGAGGALGVAAAWALGIAGGTAILNLLRRRVLLPRLRGKKEAIVLTMKLHRKLWLPIHLTAGLATLGLGIWHGLAEREGHWTLWASMGVFGFLNVGGAVLAWKWTPATVRKGVYLLHSQQLLFLATVGLLFLGHALVGD